jgi:NAD(P)-dependent dehydrogenase (short-subunit alcohol dehydrogenase family)
MRLQGKVALITGGGAGIGAAIAQRFAVEGATVHVTGVRMENTRKVTMDLRDAGYEAVGRVMDVTDSRAVAATVSATVGEFGRLDVVVANAALEGTAALTNPLLEMTDAEWKRTIDVNLTGVFFAAREAARVMVPQGSGCIIVLGSPGVSAPEVDTPAYAASKAGVEALMRNLARDFGPHGIRVNGIAPGNTDSERMIATNEHLGLTEEALLARIPLGRRAQPDEIAGIATFLASDEAAFVTGHMLVADGGQRCL